MVVFTQVESSQFEPATRKFQFQQAAVQPEVSVRVIFQPESALIGKGPPTGC